jgi:4'-phosphopantetheinyl transferase
MPWVESVIGSKKSNPFISISKSGDNVYTSEIPEVADEYLLQGKNWSFPPGMPVMMQKQASLSLSPNSFSFVDLDWETVKEHPRLFTGEIHLWWLPLNVEGEEAERFRKQLTDREMAKLERLRDNELKTRFLSGRGILRQLIAGYLGIASARVSIHFSTFGKPYIRPAKEDAPQLSFNYSDSHGMGLFAFSWNCELGVDLEWLGRRGRFRQIIERRFAESEQPVLLNGLDEDGRAERFLACWTRKEGYGKARGVGIHYPMREIDLCSDCDLPSRPVHRDDEHWYMRQLHLPPDYVGCLVSEGEQGLPVRAFRR